MGRKRCRRKGGKGGVREENGRESNGSENCKEIVKKNGSRETYEGVLNVYKRVKYPPIGFSRFAKENSMTEGNEEESVELKFAARRYFAPSLCLICMQESRVTCEHCEMVSYCTTDHQTEGWSKHRDLCAVLKKLQGTRSRVPRSAETGRLCGDLYRVYRIKSLEIVESEMPRPLDLWEKEIILYPRICKMCGEMSSKKLAPCSHCQMDFFCGNHEKVEKEEQEHEHERWCLEYEVFRTCLFLQHNYGCAEPKLPKTRRDKPVALLEETFDSLMLDVFCGSPYYYEMDALTYASLSQIATIPLTTLYGMQASRGDWSTVEEFGILVIGAEFQFECINLRSWERLFLHLLPNLKQLSVTFVGPELRLPGGVPAELLAELNLCSACNSLGRMINFAFHPSKFYHEVVRSPGGSFDQTKVDLICLFNPGLYRETGFQGRDTWPDTIREFLKTKLPVVITSYTEEEIPRDILRVRSISDVEVLLQPRRNPCSSIKPDRNFVSDQIAPLIYKNYYLAIVRGTKSG